MIGLQVSEVDGGGLENSVETATTVLHRRIEVPMIKVHEGTYMTKCQIETFVKPFS